MLFLVAEQMPQLVPFRIQEFLSMLGRRNPARHPLSHANSSALERRYFVWIIREQTHLPNIQSLKNFDRHEELALIGLKAQPLGRLHRVESAVLQSVRLQLRHQANAAALLLFIHKDARSR